MQQRGKCRSLWDDKQSEARSRCLADVAGNASAKARSRFPAGMTERNARAKSRSFAPLRMTILKVGRAYRIRAGFSDGCMGVTRELGGVCAGWNKFQAPAMKRIGRRMSSACFQGSRPWMARVDCCEEGQRIRRARGVVVRRVRARWMMKDVGMVRGAVSYCVMRGLRRMVSVRRMVVRVWGGFWWPGLARRIRFGAW